MTARVPLPVELSGRAFSRTDAVNAGLGLQRFSGPDLQRSFRGVRSTGLDLSRTLDRSLAYAARMPPTHVFSHLTAAELLGIPLPRAALQLSARTVHVSAPTGTTPPRMRGVTGHRSDANSAHLVLANGLRVLPPITVWCQLATTLNSTSLVIAGDYLLGGSPARIALTQLTDAVAAWSPRRGSSTLRGVLPHLRAGVDSPKESELRLLLVHLGFAEPLVNQRFYDEEGRYLGRADLSWPELRIVFEYEGDLHRTDRRVFRQDLARRERFESAGWSVIRVTDDDLGPGRLAFVHTVRARISRQRVRMASESAV